MIREYEESDIEELLQVWYASSSMAHPFLGLKFMEKEKMNVREIYIPNTKTRVFANEDGLDGFISMMENEVGAIFVRPEKQGQGIGKRLMDFVSQFHDDMEVEVFKDNKTAKAFYEKYGFKLLKEHTHEETTFKLLRMKFSKQNAH